jgi:hypothetical protein
MRLGPPARTTRPPLFISWISHHGRSEELAEAFGAECRFIAVGTLRNKRTTVFRHLWQAVVTLAVLASRRPPVVYVMAPPAGLVLVGLLWCRLTRSRLVVDCHSGAVLGRPLSARLAEHADLVLVTLPQLTAQFSKAPAIAIHSPPSEAEPAPRHDEIVFPASWFSDEPLDELLDAARALPDQRFAITGRPPADLRPPANVRLTGFLTRSDYLSLLAGAPLVLALTTREDTMQQAAYEAVAAGRPVVASDTRALRSYLGEGAVYARDLAAAVREGLQRLPELERTILRVREEQRVAFDEAMAEIERVLS